MIKKFIASFAGQIFIVLMGLAIVSACSVSPKAYTETALSLDNTHWVLKSIDGQAVSSKRLPELSFEAGRISGFSGCNRLFGNYAASNDGTLALGQLGATKMACMGSADALEKQVMAGLNHVGMYSLTHSQLSLMDARRKVLMIYTPKK